jgi:hypothetical protein
VAGHVACDLDGETVILNLDTGIYYGLNRTGTRIWQLLADERSLDDLIEALRREYGLGAAECESVAAFTQKLAEAGLLIEKQ